MASLAAAAPILACVACVLVRRSRDDVSSLLRNSFFSSSSRKFHVFISHFTKDDSHNAFNQVQAFLSAKDFTVFNPTTHLSHVEEINTEAMQGAVKRSKLVVAALSEGFFTSSWCEAEIAAAKEAGIKVIPVFSGDDHAAKQVDKWVDTYQAHPVFGYIFRENVRDVLNKQNPSSVKKTLAHLATLVPRDPVSGVELTLH